LNIFINCLIVTIIINRIKDPSLEDQIISRAHRMGATGPVKVELIQVLLNNYIQLSYFIIFFLNSFLFFKRLMIYKIMKQLTMLQ
jgi:hypothetical protein